MTTSRPLASPLLRPVRLGVLISGSGTTLANFVRFISERRLKAEIPIVIASRAGCGGIERAKTAGLRVEVVPRKKFATIESFSEAVFALLRSANVDLVALGGFLSKVIIPQDFQWRVMNIHPALIPAFCGQGFYGHKVHETVLERGVKVSGCTVHFADNEFDHGPIILQKPVPVLDGDTPDTLAARVFEAECEAYPEAIRLFAAGKLEVAEGKVRILA